MSDKMTNEEVLSQVNESRRLMAYEKKIQMDRQYLAL